MIRILVQEGDAERASHVVDRAVVRIGRDPSNEVVVRDRFVSARHGEIRAGAEGLCYEDFCTTNGSRVRRGDQLLTVGAACGHRIVLREGDELLLGDVRHPVRIRLELTPGLVFGRRGVVPPPRDHAAALDGPAAELGDTVALAAAGADTGPLDAIGKLVTRLSTASTPSEILSRLATTLLEAIPRATHATVHVIDGAHFRPVLAMARSGACAPEPISRLVRDRVLESGRAIAFTDVEEGFDLAESLHDRNVRAGLCAPLSDGKRVRALVQVDSRGGHGGRRFEPRDLDALSALTAIVAGALERERQESRLRASCEEVVGVLVTALEVHDPAAARRSAVVADLCEATCLAMGHDPATTRIVRRAALLRDLGSLAREADERTRRDAAERILHGHEALRELEPVLRHQRERWDGTGTPDGLQGRDVPLGSRVLAACSAWDSLAAEAASAREATSRFRGLSGTLLDPDVVDAVIDLAGDQGSAAEAAELTGTGAGARR